MKNDKKSKVHSQKKWQRIKGQQSEINGKKSKSNFYVQRKIEKIKGPRSIEMAKNLRSAVKKK